MARTESALLTAVGAPPKPRTRPRPRAATAAPPMPRTEVAAMSRATAYDAIVIGGGHNGLVAAGDLAEAGGRALVLERRGRLGGAIGTGGPAPGGRRPARARPAGRPWSADR